jgi:hypothetical protein
MHVWGVLLPTWSENAYIKEVSVVERKLFMKMFIEVTENPHAFGVY